MICQRLFTEDTDSDVILTTKKTSGRRHRRKKKQIILFLASVPVSATTCFLCTQDCVCVYVCVSVHLFSLYSRLRLCLYLCLRPLVLFALKIASVSMSASRATCFICTQDCVCVYVCVCDHLFSLYARLRLCLCLSASTCFLCTQDCVCVYVCV